jgi:hypothetical protein
VTPTPSAREQIPRSALGGLPQRPPSANPPLCGRDLSVVPPHSELAARVRCRIRHVLDGASHSRDERIITTQGSPSVNRGTLLGPSAHIAVRAV